MMDGWIVGGQQYLHKGEKTTCLLCVFRRDGPNELTIEREIFLCGWCCGFNGSMVRFFLDQKAPHLTYHSSCNVITTCDLKSSPYVNPFLTLNAPPFLTR